MSNLQTVHDRLKTNSMKYDRIDAIFNSDEVLPIWVADMDLKAPEAVNEALIARAEHGIYGYTFISEDIKENVTNWIKEKHNWDVKTDWLTFSPRSEEHTSELQSRFDLVCRLLLEKKNNHIY